MTVPNLSGSDGGVDVSALTTYLESLSSAVLEAVVQSETAHTLALTDAGKVVEYTNASPVTVTVPANATVAFPVGTVIELHQYGAGQVTVVAAGAVTLNSFNDRTKIVGRYSSAVLRKRATNEWELDGSLTD